MNRRYSSAKPYSLGGFDLAPVIAIALFTLALAMFGGSSRFDAVQAAALRPLAALLMIPALYLVRREDLSIVRAPLIMIGLFAIWMAVQLVPLPPGIWQSLAGRDAFANIDAALGLGDIWRPISFSPMRGWNALASLIVPISAALLMVALNPSLRVILLAIVALGVADALLGLGQVASGPSSPLYFYTHTNLGSAVGIFANENHSGVFSVIVLLVIARLALFSGDGERGGAMKFGLASAFCLVGLALLVSGSRAAHGLAVGAAIVIALLAWLSLKKPRLQGPDASKASLVFRHPKTAMTLGAATLIFSLIAYLQSNAGSGMIASQDWAAAEELRWKIVPTLRDMISAHWMLGTGFGSFDVAYMIFEPTDLANPPYVNQAHNDWAQFVIEGGIIGLAPLFAIAAWLYARVSALYALKPMAVARAAFWTAIATMIALASLFDYPLRTPTFQAVAMWMIIALALDARDYASKVVPASNSSADGK